MITRLNVEALIWKDAVRVSREARDDGLLLLLTVGIVTKDGEDYVRVWHEIEPGVTVGTAKNEDDTRIPLSQIVERRVIGSIILKDSRFIAKRVKKENADAAERNRTENPA